MVFIRTKGFVCPFWTGGWGNEWRQDLKIRVQHHNNYVLLGCAPCLWARSARDGRARTCSLCTRLTYVRILVQVCMDWGLSWYHRPDAAGCDREIGPIDSGVSTEAGQQHALSTLVHTILREEACTTAFMVETPVNVKRPWRVTSETALPGEDMARWSPSPILVVHTPLSPGSLHSQSLLLTRHEPNDACSWVVALSPSQGLSPPAGNHLNARSSAGERQTSKENKVRVQVVHAKGIPTENH